MTKPYKFTLTQGVDELKLTPTTLDLICMAAQKIHTDKGNWFISLKNDTENKLLHFEDGDGKSIASIENLQVPIEFWAIVDDYEDKFIVTLLLPSEY